MSDLICVSLNGRQQELRTGATLLDALARVGVAADQPGVAVALDDEVVRRVAWPSVVLVAGARIEVVGAAQGG